MFYRTHERVTLDTGTLEITKQSHKQECDINFILKQYSQTGIINHITSQQPLYSDLPSNIDYQNSQNLLIEANDTFATLPSKTREYFQNDPATFLAAFQDPTQEAYLRSQGFLKPLPAAAAAQPAAQTANPTASP